MTNDNPERNYEKIAFGDNFGRFSAPSKRYTFLRGKKFILFLTGFFILILGITLILVWWKDAAVLFRGAVGIILALAGLLMLYAVNK